MNKTQQSGSERSVEQIESAPVHLAGLEMVDQHELAAVQGGSFSWGGPVGGYTAGTFLLPPPSGWRNG
jgi:hypothetical protein